MRQNFENSLKQLQQDLMTMGNMVDVALERAIVSLAGQDLETAKNVIAEDKKIDALQLEIEDKSLMLIALQQPMAKDLRILSTALKITIDLERIGDHAKNIAEVTLEIGTQPLMKKLVDIPKMANLARIMLTNALNAYVQMDVELAKSVCQADDEVDDLCDYLLRELLEFMIADSSTINQASQLLYITRCLERIGDHAKNIAESVAYLVTGQRLD